MPQFAIYAASAGSGKTYTLTLEYLTLALAPNDATAFKHILALTFTNDAAGEMKRRIVQTLRELAGGGADGLLDDLVRNLSLRTTAFRGQDLTTPDELRAEVRRRAAVLFQRVLYDYADFAVGTIDSFGQRIVTSFARDLGLPPSFEVELDSEAVLAAAVGLLLDRVNRTDGPDEALTSLLREYADEAGAEGRSLWRLAEKVAEFSQALFNDTYLDVITHLTGADVAKHQQWREAIRTYLADVEDRVAALGERALTLITDAGLTEKHFHQGTRGIYGYFLNARTKWQSGEAPNSYVRATIDNDAWASGEGKKSPHRERLDAIADQLRTLYDEIEALREREQGGYLLLRAMQPHALGVALLGEVQKLVADISRERGVVLIGEFNRRIAGVVLREPVPFVYEKLGERYQHLLLDEFQDTSALQWHNLLPLIENGLSNDYRSLAVGDAKQAIYRWRGGELEQIVRLYRQEPGKLLEKVHDPDTQGLLQSRYDTLSPSLEPRTLRENWRSRPEIVRFTNLLFTYWATRWGSEVPLLAELYDEHFPQQTPDRLLAGPAGHVEVLLTHDGAPALSYDVPAGTYHPDQPLPGYQPDSVLDYDEAQLNLTLAIIEQSRADGFAFGDLAVLCRTRAQSRAVAKQLKERGYPISSADSLALSFADAVNLLVQLLKVLHQPTDGPARAAALLLLDKLVSHLAPGPARLRHVAKLADPNKPSRPFWEEVNRFTAAPFEPLTAGNLGLYELSEQLTSALGLLAAAPAEAEYVFGFLDLTLEYSLRYGNNVGGYLDFWEQSGRNRPISTPAAGRDAITIQTVHKAKGLAYGVVIVPFADWPLRPRAGSLLWGLLPHDTELPVEGLPPAAVVTQSDRLAPTPLGPQYQDEQHRTFVEVLNLLYVAFTRPKHRLYVVTRQLPKAPDAGKLPLRTDALLYDFLTTQGWEPGQPRFLFSRGDPAPPLTAADLPAADADRSPWGLTNLSAVPWTERLSLKRHATTVFDFHTQRRQREASQRLRLALRRLQCADDLEQVLHNLRTEGIIRADEQEDLRQDLTSLFKDPRLAPYFQPGIVAETERPILLNEVGGQPTDYQPDRFVFGPNPSQVTLLDFRLPPADPPHVEDQKRHAELFRRMGYQQVEGLIYYFETAEVIHTGA